MIQAINHPGRLKVGVMVLLCFAYRFAMPTFKLVILIRLVFMVINLSDFQILGFVGCTEVVLCFGPFVWLPVYPVLAIAIDFWGFPGFPVYLEK